MKSHKIENLIEINKLRFRLESLADSAAHLNRDLEQIGAVRLKPYFRIYNNCIKKYKALYPKEFKELEFECLPLYGKNETELFTQIKVSTLVSQSRELISILKGILYPYENYLKVPGNITLKWLLDNANYKFWLKSVGFVFFLIAFGIFISETNLYKNVKPFLMGSINEIIKKPKMIKMEVIAPKTKKIITNSEGPMP